jgi:hypothetical protein
MIFERHGGGEFPILCRDILSPLLGRVTELAKHFIFLSEEHSSVLRYQRRDHQKKKDLLLDREARQTDSIRYYRDSEAYHRNTLLHY